MSEVATNFTSTLLVETREHLCSLSKRRCSHFQVYFINKIDNNGGRFGVERPWYKSTYNGVLIKRINIQTKWRKIFLCGCADEEINVWQTLIAISTARWLPVWVMIYLPKYFSKILEINRRGVNIKDFFWYMMQFTYMAPSVG